VQAVVARPRIPWAPVVGVAVVVLAVALRFTGLGYTAGAQTFTLIFTAIVVEALPFVLLGAVVSAGIEVFVGDRSIDRIARLPLWLQMPAAALGGVAFPVCECGSVPVSRRLIRRGIHPAAGITFMLASPIFNPIVLASTWIAYSPRGLGWQMVAGRAGAGVALAIATGWALGSEGAKELLRSRPGEHDHEHGESKAKAFVEHFSSDFFFMGKFLVAGAAFAAALQTAIPQSIVSGVATTPVIGTLGLMAVAYLSSLCSEADAFVAVSFTQFPLGSQLGFLVFGPVLDLKLSFLYSAAFKRRFVLRLAAVAIPVTLATSLVFEMAIR
jgi:uncharacterized membrane protein YraQ (UPF0718 family)